MVVIRIFSLLCLVSAIFYNIATIEASDSLQSNGFNYEVEARLNEYMMNYLSAPSEITTFLSNYYFSGGFPFLLEAPDRYTYLKVADKLKLPQLYYALENGLFAGFTEHSAYYREPGNSGYDLDDNNMRKYLNSCVNKENGEVEDCILAPGRQYVSCERNSNGECSDVVELCEDEESQKNCTSSYNTTEDLTKCSLSKKYCKHYTIKTLPTSEENKKGYLPLTYHCVNIRGEISEAEGEVVQNFVPPQEQYDFGLMLDPEFESPYELGNCMYKDGKTPVERNLSGNYASCGSLECNSTFLGGYESAEYDPRYRPWYIHQKKVQKPTFVEPYVFVSGELGITWTHPMYNILKGKRIFKGVLAVDYRFKDITEYLVESWGDSTTSIAVYEESSPNYLISLSTGTRAARHVFKTDKTTPCDIESSRPSDCIAVRISMDDLADIPSSDHNFKDKILAQAYKLHQEKGYPKDLLVVNAKTPEDYNNDDGTKVYLTNSLLFVQPNSDLRWRILVASPGETISSDAIKKGNASYGGVVALGTLGIVVCIGLLIAYYNKRTERSIIYSDWRFTCAFIAGCALLNSSSFALLGPNTDVLCMSRMWTFHLFFSIALAPLLVKIWRMYMLVGGESFKRVTITNAQTVMYMMPIILIMFLILLVISFADPPKHVETIESSNGIIFQRSSCSHRTIFPNVFTIGYEVVVLLFLCVLAYKTKNMDKRFRETSQLIFTIYSMALIDMTLLVVIYATDIETADARLLQALGVFWETFFCCSAFVVPRLIQITRYLENREVGESTGS